MPEQSRQSQAAESKNDSHESTEGYSVGIHLKLSKRVNLAQQQNSFPLLHDLRIENLTESTFRDVVIELSADPKFVSKRTWRFDQLNPKEQLKAKNLDLELSRVFLAELREAVKASVKVEALVGGELAGTIQDSVKVLSPDQWGGLGHLPDLTAAFCKPNDPAVETVLKTSAKALQKAGKGAQLDGYQSKDRNRVWNQISAVYAALCSLDLDYTAPPASFEQEGQKVRSPTRILETGLATCFDLALFAAACLEQCGLNPLIILKKGHAFVGCWLVETDFSTTLIDDCQSIRKRQQLGEMVLFETNPITQRLAPPFSVAADLGNEHLLEEDQFECALDISRARMNSITPLMEVSKPPKDEPAEEPVSHSPIILVEDAPELPTIEIAPQVEEQLDSPDSRVEQWKRKLLDLTLHNKLLNFRTTKKSLSIYCPDPAKLEDILADGHRLKFTSLPDIMGDDDPRDAELHRSRRNENAKDQYALQALQRKQIVVPYKQKEMEDRLVGLFRQARSEMEEGGANTLFIAIGFLNWKQAQSSDRILQAPLILIPVTLERKSVRASFKLLLHDDDPVLNPTLLEMLRRDFQVSFSSLEDELPRDESGLDVPKIWHIIRQGVRDIRGWEVTEEVFLGTFSFTKYLMWKDLQDRLGKLKKNPVVKHLIETPKDPYPKEGDFPDVATLDDKYPPQEVFCPLSADSSQLAAVIAAAQGKDFVVVGPPGTGKSQTITNMIVQCLAEGKTVLFVSEKMAALEVVYRRLRQVGLGAFCLELHSSKARKIEVLEQLKAAWQTREACDENKWQDATTRLANLRNKLNQYPRRLHHRYPNGLTPYVAFGRILQNVEVPEVRFAWSSPSEHHQAVYESLRGAAINLDINVAEIEDLLRSPFKYVLQKEWSTGWRQELKQTAEDLRPAIGELMESASSFKPLLGETVQYEDNERLQALSELAELLPKAAGKDYGFAFASDTSSVVRQLELAVSHGRARLEKRKELSCEYRPEVTKLDLDEIENQWQTAASTWWPKSFFAKRAVAKQFQPFTPDKRSPSQTVILEDLEKLKSIKYEEATLDQLTEIGKLLGSEWEGVDTDWDSVDAAIDFAKSCSSALHRLSGGDFDNSHYLRRRFQRLVTEGNDLLSESGGFRQKAQSLVQAHTSFRNKLAALCKCVGASDAIGLGDTNVSGWLSNLDLIAEGLIAHLHRSRAWCAWRKARLEAVNLGMTTLVEALERGEVERKKTKKAFEVNYCRWWINLVVDGDDVLRDFNSAAHEQSIGQFKRLDSALLKLASRYIKARISGGIPSQAESGNKARTEWGILNREMTKKRRHMPLRKLISSLPNALTKLTPCLLMSPLSVAQYLTSDTTLFDVVIFDEASQIPVWDAIGPLARGKQAVIVGDPKQLPPTSFFQRADEEEFFDDDTVEDLESILDECQGANMPSRFLRWHYRSRHESLIVFSNHQYYQGHLVTFPSSITQDKAVEYFHVPEGVYEKGKSRVNREEAKAVVSRALDWLRDPEFVRNKWTLGVVTFNQQQQMLIEDLLDEERRNDPELEFHFGAEREEPVFVKNLENVQGDERDVILFSITYGPDLAGRVSMNFGPLNRDGGERRLNVAITRARRALQVVGTLKPEHIDLSRTKAIGVRDFKHFLEFADLGPRALAEAAGPTHGDYESGFEQEVAEELQQRGWTVHPQVGVSGFRVDLGVVHPEYPVSYLAGVECDGATYHSSATARDRDKLRESVLRGLGWNILRVWSTDWWIDRSGSATKLHNKLEKLLEVEWNTQDEFKRKQLLPEANTPNKPRAIPKDIRADLPKKIQPARFPLSKTEKTNPVAQHASGQIPSSTPEATQQSKNEVYRAADPASIVDEYLDGEEFYLPSSNTTIKRMVNEVVKTEGPIALDLVIQRVARAYGFKRSGNRITKRIKSLIRQVHQQSVENGRVFLWPSGLQPASWTGFRVNPKGSKPLRSAEYISEVELRNLADHVREIDFPLDDEALMRGMAERLGYKRITKKLETIIQQVLTKYVQT